MRKYFTWRCVGLHLLVLVLVPSFLLAGWWQYDVARSGNDLSWVYTFEWPFFALYALYIWWKLIHDRSTPFDRLWAAKQRAAADANGTPAYQIPGWAMDKELSQEVRRASIGAAGRRALPDGRAGVLAPGHDQVSLPEGARERGDGRAEEAGAPHAEPTGVIDSRVLDVRVLRDEASEALDAYNRYLFELSRKDPPKRWTTRKGRPGAQGPPVAGTSDPVVGHAGSREPPGLPREGATGGRA